MCRSCADGGRRCPGQFAPHGAAAHNARRRAARTVHRLTTAGIDARRAVDSPRLYWWDGGTGAAFSQSKVSRLRDPAGLPWKPAGGVWAAPLTETCAAPPSAGFHTTWTDYFAIEAMGHRGTLTELTPAAGTVAVHLSSDDDIRTLMGRWPLTVETAWGEEIGGFSYEAMRADGVDLVYVHTGPLLAHASLLNGWDVESAVWLNPGKARPGKRTHTEWLPVDQW